MKRNGKNTLCCARCLGATICQYQTLQHISMGHLSFGILTGGLLGYIDDIQDGLKAAAMVLGYPVHKGNPIDQMCTHSLQGGGVNTLSLVCYLDQQHKNGKVVGDHLQRIFQGGNHMLFTSDAPKHEEVIWACHIACNMYHDITNTVFLLDSNVAALTA